jgi:ATP-binding cassette subfamily B protein
LQPCGAEGDRQHWSHKGSSGELVTKVVSHAQSLGELNGVHSAMTAPLFRLLRYAKPHRAQLIAASACSILNKLFDLAPPLLIGMAVDVVVKQEDSLLAGWGVPDPMNQLWVIAGLTVFIWGMESVFEYAFGVLWRNLAQTIQHELRVGAYDHIQNLDLGWFQEHDSGGLMAILNDDVNQLERFLDGGANDILQVSTTVIAVGIAFTAVSPAVAALSFLPVPIILGGSFAFQRRIGPRYAAVRQRVSDLSSQLANNLGGIATIKAYTSEAHEKARVEALSDAYRDSNRSAIRMSAAFSPLIRMAIVVGFTGTLMYGGSLALNGVLEVGAYSVLVFLTQRLLWPLTRLGATFDLYQRAMASTSRVLDLLDTPLTMTDGGRPLPIGDVDGALGFHNLTFAYPDRDPVLHNVSIDVPAGGTVAIVGSTGSGKSTLVRLLLRLFDAQQGHITVDGVDHKEWAVGDLRRAIGLVSQNVFLFSGTVRENIRYGSFDASDEDVERAAASAEATEFINALPQRYDTVIGERGVKLSGGQRQRLSIARALLKNPPILVLDEATSSVDNETEAAIQRSLERVTADRTTVIIAHRLSTIRNADSIIVLEHGQVVELGRHDALTAQGGVYAGLWAVQTGEAATH